MPTVPRSVDPIADPRSYQREQAHHFPGAFGRGLGNALAGVGKSIDHAADSAARIVIQEQDKDNDREAKEMDVRLTQAWRERLYGENGFYNQQGTNAVAASGAIKQELEKLRGEIRGTASNPLVGEMFDTASAFRMERELESIDRFASKERKVANVLAMETRAKEAVEDAMVRWNDPEALARSEHILKHETLNMAEEMGWEPEVAQSKLEEGLSNIYLGAVEMALSSGNASDAKQMFAQYSDKLDAKGTAAAVKAIKALEKQEEAEARSLREEQRSILRFQWAVEDRKQALQERIDKEYNEELSQQITNEYMDLGLTYDEMRKEASKITDADLREEVERRMHNAQALEERARADMMKETGRKINQLVAEGATYDEAVGQLSEAERQHLFANPSLIQNAQELERRTAENKLYANTSDDTTLRSLKALEPEELAKLDIYEHRHKLTRQETAELENSIKRANAYVEKSDEQIATRLSKVASELQSKDLKGNKVFFDGSKPRDTFTTLLTDLRDWAYDQEKPPSTREIQQKAAQLSTVYEGDTTWIPGFGSFRQTVRDMQPEQRAVAKLPYATIPSSVLTDLELAVADAGVKVKDVPKSWFEEAAAALLMYQQGISDQGDRYSKLIQMLESFDG